MSKNLNTWIKELKTNLENKGYVKDIPMNVFKTEFMILSGYGKQKINEWVDNFKMCELITINDNKINFQ